MYLSRVSEGEIWLRINGPLYIGGASEKVVVEDFKGDGALDIASTATEQWVEDPQSPPSSIANRDITSVHIYAGDGTRQFVKVASLDGTEELVAVDYDSDGDTDLVTRQLEPEYPDSFGVVIENQSSGAVSFEIGTTTDFKEYQALAVESPTYDINGDA